MISSTNLKLTNTLVLDSDYLVRVTLLQNDTKFATCSDDQKIRIYPIGSDAPEATLTCNSGVNNVIELKNGNLVTSDKKGEVKLWNAKTYTYEVTLTGHKAWVLPLLELPDNRLVSGDGNGKIKVWDLVSYKCIQDIDNEQNKSPDQTRFDCQGLLLMEDNVLLCSNFNKITGYKFLKTGKTIDLMSFFNVEKRVFKDDPPFVSFEGHTASIRVLRALSDKVRFLSGSDDKSIKLWDIGSGIGSQICISTLNGHQERVSDLVIYDENTVVSGDKAGILKVWDLKTGTAIQEISTKDSDNVIEQVTSIAMKKDKTVLTSLGDGPVLKFWFSPK